MIIKKKIYQEDNGSIESLRFFLHLQMRSANDKIDRWEKTVKVDWEKKMVKKREYSMEGVKK